MLIVHADIRLSANDTSPQSEITAFDVFSVSMGMYPGQRNILTSCQTLWPFLWPKTRQGQINIIALCPAKLLSTLFVALSMTEEKRSI